MISTTMLNLMAVTEVSDMVKLVKKLSNALGLLISKSEACMFKFSKFDVFGEDFW